MKRLFLSIALLTALAAQAVQVNSEAGSLESLITDNTITQLTITGTIDARDIHFIATQLPQLATLDMSQAQVAAYEGDEPVFQNEVAYAANEIPATAFFGNATLQSVTLPATVTAVGKAAFSGCSQLAAINGIDHLTTMGDYAFSATAIPAVSLTSATTQMGTGVFSRCPALQSATVATASLGEAAFKDCAALAEVTIAAGVQEIGAEAFAGDRALTGVDIAAAPALAVIGEKAFMGSGIEQFPFEQCEQLTTLGMWAMANTPLQAVNLPQSVQEIGQGAFFYNTELQSVSLPQGYQEIASYLLAGDNNVSSDVAIAEGVTTVGDYAFYNWDQIAQFVVPASVNYIGTKAMAGMTGLTKAMSQATTVPELGDDVWAGVDQPSVPLTVPKGTEDAYKGAAQWQEFNIEAVKTGLDTPAASEASVSARFEGTTLVITASDVIARATVYAVNGVLLNEVAPGATQASLETMNYSGNYYVVTVTLADGTKRVLKLSR